MSKGRRPHLTAATRQIIIETMAMKRHYGQRKNLALGLPTVDDLAAKYFTSPQVIYRICCGRKPYKNPHPRDVQQRTEVSA